MLKPHPTNSTRTDRTWPIPSQRWLMRMTWHDLLFMHYRVEVEELRSLIPEDLEIDTFDGSAWLGIVPFRMTGIAPRWMPPVPGLSSFPELNVRTYVSAGGKPGVWFFSLDACNAMAVRFARWSFHLPYMHARMRFCAPFDSCHGTWIKYRCQRTDPQHPPAEFKADYRPIGPPVGSPPGSLASFLTARYCLYSADGRGQVFRGEIDHPPWELREAQAVVTENTMAQPLGIRLPEQPDALHYAKKIRAVAWPITAI